MSEKFEKSKESGAHHKLHQMVGKWSGITKTWFEAKKLADESPMQGTIKAILDGRFLLHEYTGKFQGKSFEGIAIYGYHMQSGKFQSAWIDSFHMGTGIMYSEGDGNDNDFSVLGSYQSTHPDPEIWRWRTEIEVVNQDELVITAYNISPSGEEAKATETIYTRRK